MSGPFFLTSQYHGLVLDVHGGSTAPGTPVIFWPKKEGAGVENQLWHLTKEGFIVNAASGLVLDIYQDGGPGTHLIIFNKKDHYNHNQLWTYDSHSHSIVSQKGLVIDVNGGDRNPGVTAIVWHPKGSHDNYNQRFAIEPYQGHHHEKKDKDKHKESEAFFIRSQFNGLVLDVANGSKEHGAPVIFWHKKDHSNKNQQWFFDKYGQIQNKDSGLVLTYRKKKGAGSGVLVKKSKKDKPKQWSYDSNAHTLTNMKKGLVLDVKDGNSAPGTKAIVWNHKSPDQNLNQRFVLEYIHSLPGYVQSPQQAHPVPVPTYTPTAVPILPPGYVVPVEPAVIPFVPSEPTPAPVPVPAPVVHRTTHQSEEGEHHRSEYRSTTLTLDWDFLSILDQIIALALGLKGKIGGAKGAVDLQLQGLEEIVKKGHMDIEEIERKIDHSSSFYGEEKNRLEQTLSVKEQEQITKQAEYDRKVQDMLDERERVEREKEAARSDANTEKQRLSLLLSDLEEDASFYYRLRPSKPILDESDIAVIRQMFLSSAVSGSGKISFADLKQILTKYSTSMPAGPIQNLFTLVENDKKGRISYFTLVAVANDLAALVADFRQIDVNGNNVLSRKEFRQHFSKLGFSKKSSIDALFRYADADESDEVGFAEYVHLALCLLVLRILFAFSDRDQSGSLSKDEVKHVLDDANITEGARGGKFEHQFTVVDDNNSNDLAYPEFVSLVLLMFAD